MYGGDNNPMSELVTELRSKLRDHYIARLPKSGLCGHRGASATHPENTVAALREAVRLGVAMVEFDVARTADGQLVLMHDATVNRTTGFNGKVSELTYAQIRALDAGKWKDAKFTGEPVPTLDEALAALPRDIWLNVHLKGDAQLGAQVAAVLARHDRLHQAFLAATKEQVVAAREQTPGVMICNMSRQNDTADYITDSIAMKADFIQLLGKGKPFTADDLRRLTSANIRINYCCTDDPQLVAKLLQQGVNFVLTDNITAAQPSAPLAR
jgi:glycerophosphoryl diester phosphodiesterase